MSSKQVLIISNPEDEHTVQVSKTIQQLGGTPILFYPENLGQGLHLVLRQEANGREIEICISNEKGTINLGGVYSVWYRRPRLVSFQDESLTPEALDFARDEWRASLESTYCVTRSLLWVSHPDKLREAARKPLQMQIAARLGLNTPRTLITNDPSQVEKFYELCNGKVIAKATGNGWVYSQQDRDEVYFVLTNRLEQDDVVASEEISIAPSTFQEEIPKDYEVRVNIVGQQVLAIKIDSQSSEVSKLDWRRYDVSNTPYSPYCLPLEIENKCLELTQMLGLEFGAIDLIRKPDGEYVFLEINGNGQFLWAEQLSGVKISHALASLLAGVSPPLKSKVFQSERR